VVRNGVYISEEVFDYGWDGDLNNFDFRITGVDCDSGWGYGYGGACPDCHEFNKRIPDRRIYFWNGGVQVECPESVYQRRGTKSAR
jgi:hypothetical protein